MLAILLATTPKLKVLEYEQVLPYTSTLANIETAQFTDLNGLTSALNLVSTTLEELRLTLRLGSGSGSEIEMVKEGLRFPPIQGTLIMQNMTKLKKVEIPMIMILGWFPEFAARPEEVFPAGIEQLTLRDDLVNLCPWALGFNCFKKIGLLGEYVSGRQKHASHLRTFNIRLRRPKSNDWLDDAVADNTPTFGAGVSHNVLLKPAAETHSWKFRDST
jgi:hypothetical protein